MGSHTYNPSPVVGVGYASAAGGLGIGYRQVSALRCYGMLLARRESLFRLLI